jgi:signal transduction histidine kinase/phage shock protein PspC (stress-responsive transcriptional regulator)
MRTQQIRRPRHHVVGGVCAGLSAHLGLPTAIVRIALCVMALCGGAGVLLYAWLWATTPLQGGPEGDRGAASARSILTRPASGTSADGAAATADGAGASAGGEWTGAADGRPDAVLARVPLGMILVGLALVLAIGAIIASFLGADVPFAVIVPGVVVLVGAGAAWQQLGELRGTGPDRRGATVARSVGGVALVALGILLFFVTDRQPNVWTVFVAATAVLAGVGIVLAPWAVRLVRDLAAERAAREREAERAEVAAHLHDSVLQTLALIQQKAGAGSETARLARAQEQELRRWLFTESMGERDDRTVPGVREGVQLGEGARQGDGARRAESVASGDLAQELRRSAAECERDHPVRIDVVAVGGRVPHEPGALLAAAREAMLNASRHAGGSVSVYAEVTASAIEVSIRDHGPGFDPTDLPEDHFGVRESILGRMRRAGGTASIRPGPGGSGTRVVLRVPTVLQHPDPTTTQEEQS